jgi:hypothetical protein
MEIETIIKDSNQDIILVEEETKYTKMNLFDRILYDIKKDTCNLKEFWKKYKKTIFWIFVTFIVMQYVDILSLGANFSNACQKQGIIQKGGQEGAPAPAPAPAAPAAPAAPKGDNKKDKKKQSKNTGEKKQKKGKQSANKGGKFQSFRTTGPLGNIFGKFGSIFQNAFKIIGVILLIAILGFLPILVMIYMTYKILTYMVKKVRGL